MKLLPKVLIVASIPIIFGTSLLSLLAYLVSAQEIELDREKKARLVGADAMTLTTAASNSAMAVFQYGAFQTENTLKSYFESKQKAIEATARLKVAMASHPTKLADILLIEAHGKRLFELSDELIYLIHLGGVRFAPMRLKEIRGLLTDEQLSDQLDTAIDNLGKHDSSPSEEKINQYRTLINVVLYGGSALAVVLSILLPLLLSKGVTDRLKVIIENSERLARGAKLLHRLNGSDELSDLDHQFHIMASRLSELRAHETAILDNAGAVIVVIDRDAKILQISRESAQVWGYTAEDLIGRRIFSLTSLDSANDLRDQLQSLTVGSNATFEQSFTKHDGTVAVMLLNVHNGGHQGIYCVAHDITQRKALEQKLLEVEAKVRLLVQNLPAGLILIDKHGLINFANTSALKLFGAFALSELKDRSILQYLDLEGDESDLDALVSKYAGKSFLCEVVSASDRIPIELSLDVAEIDMEKYVLAILADLTDRLAVDRIKQQLVRTMSDDVAKPMYAIVDILQNLESGELGQVTDKAKERLRVSLKESERLVRLFEDFLRIRVNDDGLFEIVKKHSSLKEIVHRAVSAVQMKATPRNISLVEEISDCQVEVDADRIVQVLVNLLTNAIKFSPDQGTIIVRNILKATAVEIGVIDQGSGIPASALLSIFEPFKQARVSDATRKGGTGLGLAICKSIVEKHNGTISAINNQGAGSTFVVTLPLEAFDGLSGQNLTR